VLISLAVTWALAITRPDGSFTVPEILPLTLAHRAVADNTNAKQTKLIDRTRMKMALLDMISLLFSEWGRSPY
jgi:hypothetical protein